MTDAILFEETRQLMHRNMMMGQRIIDGKVMTFHYTKPSPERYPFQFFWDTCFHVHILTSLGEYDMAKEHLVSLFALQHPDGFIGHMIYWDQLKPGRWADLLQSRPSWRNLTHSHMSSLIQPPMAAQAVARVHRSARDSVFLGKMVPCLKRYYDWLAENRDLDWDHLLTIISPFESGMDFKPSYDFALGMKPHKADWKLFLHTASVDLRNFAHGFNIKSIHDAGYFLVKDVGVNTIYAQNLKVLASLCREVNDPDAYKYDRLSVKVTESIERLMYDEKDDAFYDILGKSNKKLKVLTPTIFYPVVLEGISDELVDRVMKRHFYNNDEFGAPFPLPSVSKNSAAFDPTESKYIWRGPTWVVNNWFMHQFLLQRGDDQAARAMTASVRQLIEKSGFREYYNPFNGLGYGAHDFTWAGLVVDMIQMENHSNQKPLEMSEGEESWVG